jgi:DNA-binding response OmpR family regulator
MRILCVDDDDDTCKILTALLGNSGFDAVCVPNVTTALRLMASEQFLLYIIDGQLPDISGLSLCQQIRRRDGHTPVLIFSGHGYEEDLDAGMRAGCNAYIVKPAISEIVPTVRRLLAGTQVREQ